MVLDVGPQARAVPGVWLRAALRRLYVGAEVSALRAGRKLAWPAGRSLMSEPGAGRADPVRERTSQSREDPFRESPGVSSPAGRGSARDALSLGRNGVPFSGPGFFPRLQPTVLVLAGRGL